ncbi:MAG TPA: 4-hydroxy-3-methylbut-2-enyl diphosphate reductase, partial [Desulfobulbaceae bacterium]|nr:4-hydroxy-3-methylbut-2-enyl diphosphate reductase [Desulfobulbaceae bacterium]
TYGRALGKVHVLSNPEDIRTLKIADSCQVGYVTQTTLSMDDAEELIGLLKDKYPKIDMPDRTDICYATQNRQTAVRDLAPDMDLFLVVGSKNSSNSNRLREVAENQGIEAHLIDNAEEIDMSWLRDDQKIGITAGASAPEILVEEVVARLQDHEAGIIHEMDGTEEFTKFGLSVLPDFD